MNLLIRVHDIYVSSPNCTQPGFSHTQGSMYLAPCETPWCPAVRVMDAATRAAKIAEIFKQVKWLEQQLRLNSNCTSSNGNNPCVGLVENRLSLADLVWYPTVSFMEYLLPRNFGWPDITDVNESPFPLVASWYTHLTEAHPDTFGAARHGVVSFFGEKDGDGMFVELRKLTLEDNSSTYKWKYTKEDL